MPKDTFCEAVGCVWSSFSLPLWCSDLCHFDVLYRSLDFIPRVLSSLEYLWQLSSWICIFALGGYTNGDLIIWLHTHLPAAPTLTFFPLPKCTCPSTWLSRCKSCFHFLEWPGDLLPPLWWVLFPLTLGQASVQPFPWLLCHCFLVCPQQDNRACPMSAPSAPVLSRAWNSQCTQPIHTEWFLNEHKGQGFCVCVFALLAETLKLYCTVYKMPCPSFSFLSSRYMFSWLLLVIQRDSE